MKNHLLAPAVVLSFFTVACEKCAPDLVGQGLARLTVRNTGAIASAVNANTTCGFESAAVKNNWVASVEPGQTGVVTWRVENCVMEFAEGDPPEATDCNGVTKSLSGQLEVTATRAIEGYVTGDATNPVIPAGPTAITITIEKAVFKNFRVVSSDSDAVLTMINGSISGIVKPRVAADAARGVCSVPTGDATLWDLSYAPSLVHILTADRDFDVDVDSSKLSAVNGKFDDQENELWGQISVWESSQNIPINNEERPLNPDYDPEKHVSAFSCLEELAQPVRYECQTDVRPLIAQGASQLTIQTLGMIAKIAESNTSCGFSSPAIKNTPMISGVLGEPGGSATFTIGRDCEIAFAPGTVIDTDCLGKKTYASGTVRISGTKRVNGYVSGDQRDPIVPTVRDPAVLELTADFSGFSVGSDPGVNKMTVESGRLSGRVMPRLAIDRKNGACSKTTPVTAFENVTWSNARVQIESEGMRFGAGLDISSLVAQNGNKDGRENYLAGSISMDGQSFEIPISDKPELDPDYDAAEFLARFTCDADMTLPASDADCDMQQVLAEGAGRLVIQTVGALGTMVNTNTRCGFESRLVLVRPETVVGEPGQQGSMEWNVDGCDFDSGSPENFDTDCKDRGKYYQGRASIDANRVVRGLREEIDIFGLFQIDSIVPNSPDAVDLTLSRAALRNFMAFDLDPGATTPKRAILIANADLSANVHPILGESRETAGRFDAPTYIAHVMNVRLSPTAATIFFEGKQFKVRIDSVDLEAFNGSYSGANLENMIRGSVSINGRTFPYPTAAGLDPDFNLSDFTQRYQCRVTQPLSPAQ